MVSQRQTAQLTLAFSNSNPSSRNERLSSIKPRMLQAHSGLCTPNVSSLQKKVALLEQRSAGAAALIERLVDDILQE
jgi:hypothetical protein